MPIREITRAPIIAHAWDGVGPKRDCLLRVTTYPRGSYEWIHFQWRGADSEPDCEVGRDGNPDEYWHEASCVTGDEFTITHWAELPGLPPEEAAT
jgi:hypothetical protein